MATRLARARAARRALPELRGESSCARRRIMDKHRRPNTARSAVNGRAPELRGGDRQRAVELPRLRHSRDTATAGRRSARRRRSVRTAPLAASINAPSCAPLAASCPPPSCASSPRASTLRAAPLGREQRRPELRLGSRRATTRLRAHRRATPPSWASAHRERRRGSARGARRRSQLRLLAASDDAASDDAAPRASTRHAPEQRLGSPRATTQLRAH